MIFETVYMFVFLVFSFVFLPLCFLTLRNYERSKRVVIEGMAQLDGDTRRQLGWLPSVYIGVFDLFAPLRLGGKYWGEMKRQQSLALQRVLLHGLPETVVLAEDVRRSARRFRCYCIFLIAPLTVLIMLPACIRISDELAGFSGFPLAVCFILLSSGIGFLVLLPLDKFRTWPKIEDRT